MTQRLSRKRRALRRSREPVMAGDEA